MSFSSSWKKIQKKILHWAQYHVPALSMEVSTQISVKRTCFKEWYSMTASNRYTYRSIAAFTPGCACSGLLPAKDWEHWRVEQDPGAPCRMKFWLRSSSHRPGWTFLRTELQSESLPSQSFFPSILFQVSDLYFSLNIFSTYSCYLLSYLSQAFPPINLLHV